MAKIILTLVMISMILWLGHIWYANATPVLEYVLHQQTKTKIRKQENINIVYLVSSLHI